MATKQAPPDAGGWLSDLQDKYLATLDVVRAAKVAADTVKLLTLARYHAAYYEAAKAERGALDFSDLVAKTVDLLTQRSTAAWVRPATSPRPTWWRTRSATTCSGCWASPPRSMACAGACPKTR